MAVARIRKLARNVRDRIAAGEVIQRPASAVKELLENSIDAKATMVAVTIKGGGMKLLQVQDDGHGMQKQDLRTACERFTTSKISSFGDLERIDSYGFRGEALASIAHVAHVTIVSRCAGQKCAFRAQYREGCIVWVPRPCAVVRGTTITVSDLFYNVKTRLEALRGVNDGGKRILDVVTRYAVHYANPANCRQKTAVAFTCRRAGKAMPELRTTGGAGSTSISAIQNLFGKVVSRELVKFSCRSNASEGNNENAGRGALFTVQGLVSNANHSFRKRVTILFFNHRLVQCGRLKRAVDALYAEFLPRRTYPFVYFSIQAPPSYVDVNVHPTKKEVRFLHEESLLLCVQAALQNLLRASVLRSSLHRRRQLKLQLADEDAGGGITHRMSFPWQRALQPPIPGSPRDAEARERAVILARGHRDTGATTTGARAGRPKGKRADSHLVRTDSATGAIEAYMVPRGNNAGISLDPGPNTLTKENDDRHLRHSRLNIGQCTRKLPPTLSRLSSVRSLYMDIHRREHAGLSAVLKFHVFIGLVDDAHALLQHGTTVYLVRHLDMFREMLYQRVICSFGNFRPLLLSRPLSVHDLITSAVACRTGVLLGANDRRARSPIQLSGPTMSYVSRCRMLLQEKAPMLGEYFLIKIDTAGRLCSLPDILHGQSRFPRLDCLGQLMLRLCEDVEWAEEKACFSSVAWELAHFFSRPPRISRSCYGKGGQLGKSSSNKKDALRFAKSVVFPACRGTLRPPVHFSAACAGVFTKVTSVQHLYKIFERC